MIASSTGQQMASFYIPWLAAAAASAPATLGPPNALIVEVGGFELPVLRLGLAISGVLMARYLAPRRTPPLGIGKAMVVTIIMLVIAATWVIESRPSLLFAFVVSIGLGFSGYALIELAGREIEGFVKRIFDRAAGLIDKLTGTDT